MSDFKGKTIFISGATRGIGREIALKMASVGANIVVTGKSDEPHPKLPGTIYSVAKEIEELGANALPLKLDVRDAESIEKAMEMAANQFKSIDILVNNASAINLSDTKQVEVKKIDLMWQVNMRATFLCAKFCVPYLKKATNPHILTMSPPLNLNPKWFKKNLAYTISKYGMSMCTLGLAEELREDKIAVNSLWPKTIIATAAIEFNFPKELLKKTRKPSIVADAAHKIFCMQAAENTGNFFIDEDVLKLCGVIDFSKYSEHENSDLMQDFFLD